MSYYGDKRVLINASNLSVGGGVQVAHSFINVLFSDRRFRDIDFCIVLSDVLHRQMDADELSHKFDIYQYTKSTDIISLLNGRDEYLDSIESSFVPDVVFTIFGPSYWWPQAPHVIGYAKPQYIYPESPFFRNLTFFSRIKLRLKKYFHLRDFQKSSTCLVSENENVSRRAGQLLGKEVFTVTNNYNQIYDHESLWDKSILLDDFDGVTLLTISANYPHKNLQIIPSVVECLVNRYKNFSFRFVLTLNKSDFNYMPKVAEDRMVFLGRVDVAKCPYLYQQSDIMFMPTMLECFSASFPEAMKMSCPILTSDLPFLRSICKESALYFDPESPYDIADKIYYLSRNDKLRRELVENAGEVMRLFDTPIERASKYVDILLKTF